MTVDTLEPLDFPETFREATLAPIAGTHPADPLVAALNRVAAALETYNRNQGPLGAVAAPVTPPNMQYTNLPPANQQRPACPKHGSDKVHPSTKVGQSFYCSAKDPQGNARGYCTWSI